MVILNGVPFTDLAYIATLGTKDIKRIEVISSNFMVGDITFPGFVSIYTNDNKIPEIYLKNSSVTYKNTVISKIMGGEKIFNEQEENTSKHLPDFRNNLYWKPGIIVTGKEAIVLEFPVSKLTGKYIVSIQGLTLFGQPVSGNTSFEVKE